MVESIRRLLRDRTLVLVAFAIALGWALLAVAQGASAVVTTFLNEIPSSDRVSGIDPYAYGALNWKVGSRY